MPDVLNPDLYKRLCQRFGVVKVHSPGEAMQGAWLSNFGQSRWQITSFGESYGVNCFYCAKCGNPDTRHRLAINHRWGAGPPDGNQSTKFWNLAVCYNNNCQENEGFHEELRRRVYGVFHGNTHVVVKPGIKTPVQQAIMLPGLTVNLTELPSDHTANKYLFNRNFDPYYLAETYGLGYCYTSDTHPLATGRIIIPFYKNGELVGWQARYVGETDNKHMPKYYTLTSGGWSNHTVYDYDRAREVSPDLVIVCEGVTDVWRLGFGAIALLGKSLKGTQEQILNKWKTIILLLDSDAEKDINKLYEIFSTKHTVVKVLLPTGKDPGDMDKQDVWDLILENAKKQKVDLFNNK